MAIIADFNQEQFEAWVASRPKKIQEMIQQCPPDRLYRMAKSNHRCTIYSYSENGMVTVDVTGEFNRILFSRRVFGVPIEELSECDLPDKDEDVGDTASEAGYSEDDVRNILIPKLRAAHGREPEPRA